MRGGSAGSATASRIPAPWIAWRSPPRTPSSATRPAPREIEFVLLGGSFAVEGGSARLALAGAPFGLTLDGDRVPSHVSVTLRPGQILTVAPPAAGVYAVLAAAGGFDVPTALGSLSLHPRARLGGLDGRPLREGDRLPLVLPQAPDGPELRLPPLPLEPEAAIRVVLGPQADHFARAKRSPASFPRRTGFRRRRTAWATASTAPAIPHARGFNIVSDGIATGSVQVPGSGEPIVLMADRQTAGGYPKIATVISADHRVLAQRRPGDPVRFAALEVEAAQELGAREGGARRFASRPGRSRSPGGLVAGGSSSAQPRGRGRGRLRRACDDAGRDDPTRPVRATRLLAGSVARGRALALLRGRHHHSPVGRRSCRSGGGGGRVPGAGAEAWLHGLHRSHRAAGLAAGGRSGRSGGALPVLVPC